MTGIKLSYGILVADNNHQNTLDPQLLRLPRKCEQLFGRSNASDSLCRANHDISAHYTSASL